MLSEQLLCFKLYWSFQTFHLSFKGIWLSLCLPSIFLFLRDFLLQAPCQHNFCLGCFNKWSNQGKKTCPTCRHPFPAKFAANPRINTALASAIRMAKLGDQRPNSSKAFEVPCTRNLHWHRHMYTAAYYDSNMPASFEMEPEQHTRLRSFEDTSRNCKQEVHLADPNSRMKLLWFVQRVLDKDRPDEAFTTDRAVRAGRANAASGRIMVTVPGDWFGPIPPEHDPRGLVSDAAWQSYHALLSCSCSWDQKDTVWILLQKFRGSAVYRSLPGCSLRLWDVLKYGPCSSIELMWNEIFLAGKRHWATPGAH